MKHVLIVDNDPDILDIMKFALTYEGLAVTCTNEEDNIFEKIAIHKPDVLMIDYLLNKIDGSEVCRKIKEDPKTHNLPVIIMSAYPREMMTPNVGDDFISKPFDLEDLVARIKILADRKKRLHAI